MVSPTPSTIFSPHLGRKVLWWAPLTFFLFSYFLSLSKQEKTSKSSHFLSSTFLSFPFLSIQTMGGSLLVCMCSGPIFFQVLAEYFHLFSKMILMFKQKDRMINGTFGLVFGRIIFLKIIFREIIFRKITFEKVNLCLI